jgi:hypothetical protein
VSNVVNFFPYTMGVARMEIDHRKVGTYRAITLLALYELMGDTSSEELTLSLNEYHKSMIRRRILNRPKLDASTFQVLPFPNKMQMIEQETEDA